MEIAAAQTRGLFSLSSAGMRVQSVFALGVPGVRFDKIGRPGESARRLSDATGMGVFVFTTHGDVKVRFEDLGAIAPSLTQHHTAVEGQVGESVFASTALVWISQN